jgi:alkylhydroperoxidase family enzyme
VVSLPTSNIADVSEPIDELRAVVAAAAPAGPELTHYLTMVRQRAYAVTDAEVEALKAAGLSEDEIFEQTVVAAIDEGLRRLDAAERVIG